MNIDVGESPGPESWPTQQPPPPVVLVAFLRAAYPQHHLLCPNLQNPSVV
jgi:hypothetical protein